MIQMQLLLLFIYCNWVCNAYEEDTNNSNSAEILSDCSGSKKKLFSNKMKSLNARECARVFLNKR
jgi:hypothetical protein